MAKSLHENAKRHGNENVTCNSIVGNEGLGHDADSRKAINQSFTVHHTAL